MDLSFGLISKRVNCAPERSYCVRSALSTKAAAARSVLKAGIFFFIRFDLLLVHVAGTDRPDQHFVTFTAKREHDEYASPLFRSAYGSETVLALRIGCIPGNGEGGG